VQHQRGLDGRDLVGLGLSAIVSDTRGKSRLGYRQLQIGFNWAYRSTPQEENGFWTYLRDHDNKRFVSALDWVEWGIRMARRGWATRHDILNTRSLAELRPLLRRHRGAA